MFGELLKQARKRANMTQDELAEAMGVNRVAISNYEQSKNTPTLSNMEKIRAILKLPYDYFDDKKTIRPTLRPLIGSASCGVPTTYYYEDVEMIPVSENVGLCSYFIRADGESMATRINHGDLLLCDPDAMIRSGDIVHFEWDGEHGVKKYVEQNGMRMMVAFNQDYPPIIITDEYELRMVRVVLRQERM